MVEKHWNGGEQQLSLSLRDMGKGMVREGGAEGKGERRGRG